MDATKNGMTVAVTGHGYRREIDTSKEGIVGTGRGSFSQPARIDIPEGTPGVTTRYGNRDKVVHFDEHIGEVIENMKKDPAPMDFDGKDFKDTQKMLDAKARADMLRNQMTTVKTERASLANNQFKRTTDTASENPIGEPVNEKPTADEVIQTHLDTFKTSADLERHLRGDVKKPEVADRINAFFVDEDGDTLKLNTSGTTIKTEKDELEFKRSMLIYFKQNDEYMEKIDEEMKKMDAAVAEFNSEISSALNPLKDNILAYAEWLEQKGDFDNRKKAKMIRSGYTLENLIELVEKKPSIIQNSLKDFRNESRIKDIGERYAKKLKTAGVNLTLFNLLSNDVADSIEYRMLAPGDYPEGLEGFTIFFIIRSLSMSLPDKYEETFHASVQVAFSGLLKGDLDPDVAASMKGAIKKFLSYFA